MKYSSIFETHKYTRIEDNSIIANYIEYYSKCQYPLPILMILAQICFKFPAIANLLIGYYITALLT